jgi:hypothetical protein
VELLILLAQQKSTLDIIPFQVHPYSFHIGFYIYNKGSQFSFPFSYCNS